MREAHVEGPVAPLESASDRGESMMMGEQVIILIFFTFTAWLELAGEKEKVKDHFGFEWIE